MLKYIFLDDLSNAGNDDIYGFLHLCRELNNNVIDTKIKVSLDIDWFSRKHSDDEIPEEILKIIGKMYYMITEVLSIEYKFASDYLSNKTQQGAAAIEKVLKYAEEYSKQEKTEKELCEIESLRTTL